MLQKIRSVMDKLTLGRDALAFWLRCRFLAHAGVGCSSGSRRVLIVSLTNSVCQLKYECMLAKALQLHGYTPIIAIPRRARLALHYFRTVGFSEFVCLDDFVTPTVLRDAGSEAQRLLECVGGVKSLFSLEYRGVQIGRHVLSTILCRRYDGRINLSDPGERDSVRLGLEEGIRAVLAAEALYEEVHPDLVLFNEKSYVPYGPIFDVGLQRGLYPIQFIAGHRHGSLVFKRYNLETRNLHAFSLSRASWDRVKRMPWNPEMSQGVVDEMLESYKAGSWFRQKYLDVNRRLYSPDEVRDTLKLDSRKPTAVVFSHVLWDGTFFYGDSLFEDYETWLVETVRAACRNRALNWIVKLHPDYAYKMRMARLPGAEVPDVQALQEAVGNLPDHIRLLLPSTNISTVSLLDVMDYALTVRGTVGIEMPCFGIPVLTAGTGRYSGLGFTIDSASREQYVDRLANLEEQPRLTHEQVELARRHAYALLNLRPCRFTTFEPVYARFERLGHPLDFNISIRARSAREIEQAHDLRAFAEWATSDGLDFLSPLP